VDIKTLETPIPQGDYLTLYADDLWLLSVPNKVLTCYELARSDFKLVVSTNDVDRVTVYTDTATVHCVNRNQPSQTHYINRHIPSDVSKPVHISMSDIRDNTCTRFTSRKVCGYTLLGPL